MVCLLVWSIMYSIGYVLLPPHCEDTVSDPQTKNDLGTTVLNL